MAISEIRLYFTHITAICLSVIPSAQSSRWQGCELFKCFSRNWLINLWPVTFYIPPSVLSRTECTGYIPITSVASSDQWSSTFWFIGLKNLCPTESPIDCQQATDWCAVLPVPHWSNSDDDPIKGRGITDLSCRRWLDSITCECGRSMAGG